MGKRNYEETRLQIAVADYLLGQITHGKNIYPITKPFPELIFTHPANQGRSASEGAKLKRMGVRSGVPDLLFWWKDELRIASGAIELKASTGSLSPEQKQFRNDFVNAGGAYGICRTVAEVRDMLTSWGLKCYNTAVHEPPPTFAEMSKLSMEFFRP